jgi:hypothetical protein
MDFFSKSAIVSILITAGLMLFLWLIGAFGKRVELPVGNWLVRRLPESWQRALKTEQPPQPTPEEKPAVKPLPPEYTWEPVPFDEEVDGIRWRGRFAYDQVQSERACCPLSGHELQSTATMDGVTYRCPGEHCPFTKDFPNVSPSIIQKQVRNEIECRLRDRRDRKAENG